MFEGSGRNLSIAKRLEINSAQSKFATAYALSGAIANL